MTRLSDLPPAQAKRLAEVECPTFTTQPWVSGPPLSDRRIAIVSSAGLFKRGTEPFRGRDADYRVIPGDIAWPDLLTSHISINFDRTALQEDWNVVFPRDRLKELVAQGGSVHSPTPTTPSWAPAIRSRWDPMPANSPAA